MRANQLRLWFASLAYVLINELRRVGLRGTDLARAQVSTIRCRLLKVGALVTVSVRRVVAALSSAFPPAARVCSGAGQFAARLPTAPLTLNGDAPSLPSMRPIYCRQGRVPPTG